jgi:alpha-galactosidase
VAHSFVTLGLREAGYEYVNIDVRLPPIAVCSSDFTAPQDCWALLDRDPVTKEQVPDPLKFPRGIKALADHIHSLNLKLGIYRQMLSAVEVLWHSNHEHSDAGTLTCAGYPGSLYYEDVDAATWQTWGIDCELCGF